MLKEGYWYWAEIKEDLYKESTANGPFSLRVEAIFDAKKNLTQGALPLIRPAGRFFIVKICCIELPKIAEQYIEEVNEYASWQSDDEENNLNWIRTDNISKKMIDNLDLQIRITFISWMEEHGIEPGFFRINNIEQLWSYE